MAFEMDCRFLFVIMTPCFTSVACLERCINTIYVYCYQSVDFPYGIWQPLIYKLQENKHGVMFLYIIYNNSQGHPTSFYGNICSEDDLRFRIFGTFFL